MANNEKEVQLSSEIWGWLKKTNPDLYNKITGGKLG